MVMKTIDGYLKMIYICPVFYYGYENYIDRFLKMNYTRPFFIKLMKTIDKYLYLSGCQKYKQVF